MKVADLFVDLKLDTTSYDRDLKSALAKASRVGSVVVPVKLKLDTKSMQADITKATRSAKNTILVPVKADTTAASRELATVTRDRKVDISASVDGGFAARVKSLVTAQLAVNAISKGMPDLSFGMDAAAKKATLLAGGLTAVAAAGAPVLALAGGLATGFAAAGAGVTAYAALVKPAFTGVADAITKVQAAQDKYDIAKASGDSKAMAAALKEQKAVLDTLPPAQRAAAEATLKLQGAFGKVSEEFSKPALGMYTQGLKTLQGLLPQLVQLATPAAKAIGEIFNRVDAGLKSQGFKDFVTFVSAQVYPSIVKLADIAGHLGTVLKNVFVAATPVAQAALTVISNLTGKLSDATKGEGLTKFFTGLKPLIEPVGQLIENVARTIGGLIKAALPISGIVVGALVQLTKALSTLTHSNDFATFARNVGGIIQSLTPLFNTLTTTLGQVFKVLSDNVLSLMPVLVPALQSFAKVFGDVLVGLSPLLKPLIELAAVLVSQLLPAVYPVITALRTALIPVIDALTKVLIDSMPSIQAVIDAIVSLLPPVADLLVALLPLVPLFVKMLTPAITIIAGLLGGLVRIITPIIKVVVDVASALGGVFFDALTAIYKPLLQLGDAVKLVFEGKFAEAGAMFAKIWEQMRAAAAEMAPKVWAEIQKLATQFWTWVSTVWPKVEPELVKLAGQIADWVTNTALPWITTKLTAIRDAFSTFLQEHPNLEKTLRDFWTFVTDWLKNTALPWVLDKLHDIGVAFTTWLAEHWPEIKAKLAEFWGNVVDWLKTTGLPLVGAILVDIGKAFVSWLLASWPALLLDLGKWLAGILIWINTTAIPDLIKGLAGLGATIVKNIIPGLDTAWEGIKSLFGKKQTDINTSQDSWYTGLNTKATTGMSNINTKGIQPGWTGIEKSFTAGESSVQTGYGTHWDKMNTEEVTQMAKINSGLGTGLTTQKTTWTTGETNILVGYNTHWEAMKTEASTEMPKINANTLVPGFSTQKGTYSSNEKSIETGWSAHWSNLNTKASSGMKTVNDTVKSGGAQLVANTKAFVDRAGDEMDKIKARFKNPVDYVIANAFSRIRSAYNAVAKTVSMAQIPSFSGGGTVSPLRNGGLAKLAGGGELRGPGGPRDDKILGVDYKTGIPTAAVSNREFVVNNRSYEANKPLVQAINASSGPVALAYGGLAKTPKDTFDSDPLVRPTQGQRQSLNVDIPGLSTDLLKVAAAGPQGKGGYGAISGPVQKGESMVGQMGWYRRCLAFVNAAWSYSVGRFRLATAKASQNAGPRTMTGTPPGGAGVYWDTGPAGHIALAVGDGSVISTDAIKAGRIDRVNQTKLNAWGPYKGWWHPNGAKGGPGDPGGAAAPIVIHPREMYDTNLGSAVSGLGNALYPWAEVTKKLAERASGAARNHLPDQYTIAAPAGTAGGTSGSNQAIGKRMLNNDAQWPALQALWQGESGWNERAKNPSSGAYGIPQSLPASKMASAGSDYLTNAATQIKWGLSYIRSSYGNPVNAYNKWLSRSPHWYDNGGILPPGVTTAVNATGRPETIRTFDQERALQGSSSDVLRELQEINRLLRSSNTRGPLIGSATIRETVDLDRYERERDFRERMATV